MIDIEKLYNHYTKFNKCLICNSKNIKNSINGDYGHGLSYENNNYNPHHLICGYNGVIFQMYYENLFLLIRFNGSVFINSEEKYKINNIDFILFNSLSDINKFIERIRNNLLLE